jgi:hypothetical protein
MKVNTEIERIWKQAVVAVLCSPDICLDGVSETENTPEYSMSHPKFEKGASRIQVRSLLLGPACAVLKPEYVAVVRGARHCTLS